jgi:hypothetical protein
VSEIEPKALKVLKKAALDYANLIRTATGRKKLRTLPRGYRCSADDDSLARAIRTKPVPVFIGLGDVYAPGLPGVKFIAKCIKNSNSKKGIKLIEMGTDGNSLGTPKSVDAFLEAYDAGLYPELVTKAKK